MHTKYYFDRSMMVLTRKFRFLRMLFLFIANAVTPQCFRTPDPGNFLWVSAQVREQACHGITLHKQYTILTIYLTIWVPLLLAVLLIPRYEVKS